MLRLTLATVMSLGLVGAAKAGEFDNDAAKPIKSNAATAAPAADLNGGSEFDKESPTQAHRWGGWGWRGGWGGWHHGWGGWRGWGGGWGGWHHGWGGWRGWGWNRGWGLGIGWGYPGWGWGGYRSYYSYPVYSSYYSPSYYSAYYTPVYYSSVGFAPCW